MKEEQSVVLERMFSARRALVFEAWTRAARLRRWFGPRGFRITDCETDPRPGGIFRLRMHAPDGRAFWVRGAYREVVWRAAPQRHGPQYRSGGGAHARRDAQGLAQTVDRLSVLVNPKPQQEI